jgi:hypothetical protein
MPAGAAWGSQRPRWLLAGALVVSAVGLLASVGVAGAQTSLPPSAACNILRNQPTAYQTCVNALAGVPTAPGVPGNTGGSGAASPGGTSSGAAQSTKSLNHQYQVLAWAMAGGLLLALVLIERSWLLGVRAFENANIPETERLMNTLIPPEVKRRDPNATATGVYQAAGYLSADDAKRRAKPILILTPILFLIIIAFILIVGAHSLVPLVAGPIITIFVLIASIRLTGYNALRGLSQGREMTEKVWQVLGLEVTEFPSVQYGTRGGVYGTVSMRHYVVGKTKLEGTRFGRHVSVVVSGANRQTEHVIKVDGAFQPHSPTQHDTPSWLAEARQRPGDVTFTSDQAHVTVTRTMSFRASMAGDTLFADLATAETAADALTTAAP